MKITIKDGGREEIRLLKLVNLGLFKNATEATEAAINVLYEDALARELALSAKAQAAVSPDIDLASLQGISAGSTVASKAGHNADEMVVASTSRQKALLSTKGN
jgi:hypothetical protein